VITASCFFEELLKASFKAWQVEIFDFFDGADGVKGDEDVADCFVLK